MVIKDRMKNIYFNYLNNKLVKFVLKSFFIFTFCIVWANSIFAIGPEADWTLDVFGESELYKNNTNPEGNIPWSESKNSLVISQYLDNYSPEIEPSYRILKFYEDSKLSIESKLTISKKGILYGDKSICYCTDNKLKKSDCDLLSEPSLKCLEKFPLFKVDKELSGAGSVIQLQFTKGDIAALKFRDKLHYIKISSELRNAYKISKNEKIKIMNEKARRIQKDHSYNLFIDQFKLCVKRFDELCLEKIVKNKKEFIRNFVEIFCKNGTMKSDMSPTYSHFKRCLASREKFALNFLKQCSEARNYPKLKVVSNNTVEAYVWHSLLCKYEKSNHKWYLDVLNLESD